MWNLKKNDTNEFIYKTEMASQNEFMVTRGARRKVGGGAIDWEFGTDMYTLLCLKWITNKDLLYSRGNMAQYSIII